MRVAVYGGSGFVGSYAAKALAGKGHEVTVYDRKPLPSYLADDGINYFFLDILDRESVFESLVGYDYAYNYAGLADLDAAKDSPFETVDLNITGNLNILMAAKVAKVKKYLYASTVYVNSNNGGFYRCSKIAAENYVREFKIAYGLNYTILRFGSLYGRFSGDNNGIQKIIKNAMETGYLSYNGELDTKRNYIHVLDAAQAAVDCLDCRFDSKSIHLIGNESVTIEELLNLLSEITDIKVKQNGICNTHLTGHYKTTPYSVASLNLAERYTPATTIELAHGLLDKYSELNGLLKQVNA